jgi:hypothetical protein
MEYAIKAGKIMIGKTMKLSRILMSPIVMPRFARTRRIKGTGKAIAAPKNIILARCLAIADDFFRKDIETDPINTIAQRRLYCGTNTLLKYTASGAGYMSTTITDMTAEIAYGIRYMKGIFLIMFFSSGKYRLK